jgi:hypothetical protein
MTNNFTLTDQNKELLKELLKDGLVTIVFEKKDGTMREMKCTLKNNIISEYWSASDTGKTLTKTDSVLPVFDTIDKAWKSFRWDSIKQVSFKL